MSDYVLDYKRCIAFDVATSMGIPLDEAADAVIKSGVSGLIDEDPPVTMHFNVDDWADDVRKYIIRHSK